MHRATEHADRGSRRWPFVVVICCCLGMSPRGVLAESALEGDPLLAKQRTVEDRLKRLEDRLFRVRESLATIEPESAQRLEGAIKRLGELQVKDDLAAVLTMIETGRLDQATEKQKEILEDLRTVLKILMEQRADPDERQKGMERLEAFRKELEQIIKEERSHREGTKRLDERRQTETPQGDYPKMAADQKATGRRTGDLARNMSGAPSQDGQKGRQEKSGHREAQSRPYPSTQSSPSTQPAPAPGQQHVAEARESMDQAVEKLDQKDAAEAGRNQDKALEQLEAAKDELTEAIEQKREEQQEEVLRDLKERFAAMLKRQEAINQQTIALEKIGTGNWHRSEELKAAGLSKEQREVGNDAGKVLNILKEDGSTAVFPRVVEAMADDMLAVSDRLVAADVGSNTQQIQAGIVETLKQLLEAIEQKEKQAKGGSGEPGGGGGGSLLPGSAELKLLRSMQVRLNRQTLDLATPGPKERATFEKLSRRQADVSDLAREMHERVLNQRR